METHDGHVTGNARELADQLPGEPEDGGDHEASPQPGPSIAERLKAALADHTARLDRGRFDPGRFDPGRFDPGRPGLRVLLLLGLLAAVVAGVIAWRARPEVEPMAPPTPMSGGPAVPSPSPTPDITVYVTGKVQQPGVIALPLGSRVIDAVAAAGGALKGVRPGGLNLARRLIDGEQIVVGAPPTQGAVGGGAQPAADGLAGGVLNLNAATPDQLEQLPGVGEVLARRIIEFRDTHGGFLTVDQLRDVSGIGDRKYAELKDKVAV